MPPLGSIMSSPQKRTIDLILFYYISMLLSIIFSKSAPSMSIFLLKDIVFPSSHIILSIFNLIDNFLCGIKNIEHFRFYIILFLLCTFLIKGYSFPYPILFMQYLLSIFLRSIILYLIQ